MDWVPFAGGSTPDYYSNVENALQTAETLATEVTTRITGTTYISAHSLGNMVVSSAIKDRGLNVSTYFMLDAAVAMEAYDPEADDHDVIRHPSWQNYDQRLWASDWYKLYDDLPNDSRQKLSWNNFFGPIPNARNYYSSTEDVLDNADGDVPAIGDHQAWVNQEMRKGTTLIWLGPGNAEGGWGFNSGYDQIIGYDLQTGLPIYARLTPSQANALTDEALRTNSLFGRFDDAELYDPALGSTFLLDGNSDVRDSAIFRRLLADGIPALSNPAGRNPLGNVVQEDINMDGFRRGAYPNDWPDRDNLWKHSDLKNVAYPYNYKVFDSIVTDGSLK